jgi:hypothetical protein
LNLKNVTELGQLSALLQKHDWIDPATRAVAVEMLVYNRNVNLFCHLTVLFEMPPQSGMVITHHQFRTSNLSPYSFWGGKALLALEVINILFMASSS